jgi:hypothetical protein
LFGYDALKTEKWLKKAGIEMSMDQVARDIAEVEQLRKALAPHARALFGFLRIEGGFTQRPSTRWMTYLWTWLIYRSTDLSIEVEINYYTRMTSVWLIRLENGAIPKGSGPGGSPINGVIIRRRVESVLRDDLSVSDPLLDELAAIYSDSERQERDQTFLERMLELYRDLVRRHLDLLVSWPIPRLFPVGGVYEPLHRPDVRQALERQTQEHFCVLVR